MRTEIMDVPLKNPAELAVRLDLSGYDRLLLVDAPPPLALLAGAGRDGTAETRLIEGKAIRSVKDRYDAVLLWREGRVGSESLLDAIAKRTEPGGVVWIVIPLRKTMGLSTPAAHRLTFPDLVRAFPPDGWTPDREARVSAWHVAHRFSRRAGRSGPPPGNSARSRP